MDRFELSVDEVLEATKGKMISGPLCSFDGISTDTRVMGRNQLFVALKGKSFDGHQFIEEAKSKGAIGALVSENVPEDDDFVLIKVKDTRKALLDIAAAWREKMSHVKVIAITGTNGKTTTKEMVRWLLSAVAPLTAAVKSYNNEVGVPLSLLDIRPYHRFCVIEIGASKPGDILPLAKAARPDAVVITNVGTAHLEGFKNSQAIMETKGEILKAVHPDGFCVLNADDPAFPYFKAMAKVPILTFSTENEEADVFPMDVAYQTACTHFTAFDAPTKLPVGGKHNLANALAALAVCKGFDLELDRSVRRLRGFTPPPMRTNLFFIGPVVVINDAFNSNPSSFDAAAAYFAEVSSPNKIFVMGDMLELGADSAKLHAKAGERLADMGLDCLVTIGQHSAYANEAYKAKGMAMTRHYDESNDAEVVDLLVPMLESGGAVMFKASRAMKFENLVSHLIRGLKTLYSREKF